MIATDDWDRARATAWWSAWKEAQSEARKSQDARLSAKTVTLAIELDDRAPAATAAE